MVQTIAAVASIRDRKRSSPWRRASSACFHAVMSREMPNVPTIRPSSSRNGILVVETHVTLPSSPRLLLVLAHDGLPGLDDGLLVFPGRAGVLLGEEIEVRLAHGLGGVAQAKPAGQGLVDAEEAALDVLEVDRVGEGIHQRVQQVALLEDLLLGLLALDELADLAADGRRASGAGPHRAAGSRR